MKKLRKQNVFDLIRREKTHYPKNLFEIKVRLEKVKMTPEEIIRELPSDIADERKKRAIEKGYLWCATHNLRSEFYENLFYNQGMSFRIESLQRAEKNRNIYTVNEDILNLVKNSTASKEIRFKDIGDFTGVIQYTSGKIHSHVVNIDIEKGYICLLEFQNTEGSRAEANRLVGMLQGIKKGKKGLRKKLGEKLTSEFAYTDLVDELPEEHIIEERDLLKKIIMLIVSDKGDEDFISQIDSRDDYKRTKNGKHTKYTNYHYNLNKVKGDYNNIKIFPVVGHFRSQPYGVNRALRKIIFIAPQVRRRESKKQERNTA